MSVFYPDTPAYAYPLSFNIEYRTTVSESESGVEQRNQGWRFPRRSMVFKYPILTQQEIDKLWEFYLSRKGRLLDFLFIEPDIIPYATHTDEYIGRGDDTTMIFSFPARGATGVKVYVNDSEVTVTHQIYNEITTVTGVAWQDGDIGWQDGDIAFSDGDGSMANQDTDRIVFDTPPISGSLITADFTGRLTRNFRFKEDKLTKELFTTRLYNAQLEIVEVKAA